MPVCEMENAIARIFTISLVKWAKRSNFARFFDSDIYSPTDTEMMVRNNKFIGYLCGILAAAFYGLNPLFALPLYADGMDAVSVLFFRYVLSLPMLAIPMLVQRIDFRLSKGEALQLLILGLLMMFSSLLLYEAYRFMDAGIASTILFLYPILTALLMAGVFHERVSWIVWACLVLATAGVFVLCDMSGVSHVSTRGIVLVILSTVMYAAYLVFINKGHITQMPPVKTTFYALLTGAVGLGIALLLQGSIVLPEGLHWGCSIGSALFSTALSLTLTAIAIRHIGSTQTAILGAMEPLTAVVIGVTVFGEQLTGRSVIGIVMIVVAVTLAIAKK